jgi:parallel beta-helix repeat protein
MKLLRPLFAVAMSLIGCLAVLNLLSRPALAAPGDLFVATTGSGSTCSQVLPCDLQTALSQAVAGDSVYVASGVYTGTSIQVIQLSTSITLYGGWDGTPTAPVVRDPLAYPTTLDGQGQRRVVYIAGSITPTLDGFTVTGGSAVEGAGISIHAGAAPIVRNNLITNNVATGGWTGGILIEASAPLIEHNLILSNSTPFEGAGVSASFSSQPTLKNNLIAENTAGVSGAGIRLRDAEATLINNTIVGNKGAGSDGIYATSQLTTSFTLITMTNNIIISHAYGLRIGSQGGAGVTATMAYNDVVSNVTANYSGLTNPTGSSGNISLDPLFVNGFDGGYYLSQIAAGQAANSPAVNAGSVTAASLGLDDRTTRTDIVPDTGTVDLGYHHRLFDIQRIYLPIGLRNYP